jgi:hypothetical protein
MRVICSELRWQGCFCKDGCHINKCNLFTILTFWQWLLNSKQQGGQCILFSVVFTPPSPATTAEFGSYRTCISLLLPNTAVSRVRACLFKTIKRRLITSKVTLTGQDHLMLIFVLRKKTWPSRMNSLPWFNVVTPQGDDRTPPFRLVLIFFQLS